MSFALLYWILMLLWLVFGLWHAWPINGASIKASAGTLILFILLVLLGWEVFGPPVRQ